MSGSISESMSPTLCPMCSNVRIITSAKGSVFYLCELALSDQRFSKYPPQPIARCIGFQESVSAANKTDSED